MLWLLMVNSYNIHAQRDVGKKIQSNFQYENCGCDFGVNLRIFNGQDGIEIGESDEETKGAITVANKNGNNGGTEVDLMKLIIESKGNKAGSCEVKLEYEGKVTFWKASDKTGPISNLTFSSDDLPKTIWIEAQDVSAAVQDIVINANINTQNYDTVKATAIWCTLVDKYNEGNTPSPSITDPPLPSFIHNFVDTDGDFYGLGYYNNSDNKPAYGGRILIEFELFPKGAENIWPIYFDVTRKISKTREGLISGSNSFTLLEAKFPSPTDPEDLPNDDGISNDDEDNIPDHFFGFDGPSEPLDPGLQSGNNSYGYMKANHNFEEFVRMSFAPLTTSGNTIYGSRCSDKAPWIHNRCLQLWSDDTSDPYSPPNQRYKVLDGPATHSMPTRYIGNGNGQINIDLQAGSISEGYSIAFQDNNIAELYNTSFLVQSVQKTNGVWVLNDSGKVTISITDNTQNPYLPMDRIFFCVLNNLAIYNNINIE